VLTLHVNEDLLGFSNAIKQLLSCTFENSVVNFLNLVGGLPVVLDLVFQSLVEAVISVIIMTKLSQLALGARAHLSERKHGQKARFHIFSYQSYFDFL
jgi:hypothetical protein